MSAELEAAWIKGLATGDDDCYRQVVTSTIGRLLFVARRYLDDEEAQDAVQDAYVKLLDSIDKFRGDSSLLTWLQKILVNECLQRLRKKKSRRETSIEDLLPDYLEDGHRENPRRSWPESFREVMTREYRCESVMKGIRKLPPQYRDVIMLRDIEGFSGQEAAESLDISLAAVKVRLHRARQALREMLEPVILEETSDL